MDLKQKTGTAHEAVPVFLSAEGAGFDEL
jgi:hypothetical protein